MLWHCSAGKDRVGVGTALLLCALGVPKKTIYEDFMKTNMYLDKEIVVRIKEEVHHYKGDSIIIATGAAENMVIFRESSAQEPHRR